MKNFIMPSSNETTYEQTSPYRVVALPLCRYKCTESERGNVGPSDHDGRKPVPLSRAAISSHGSS